MARTEPGTRSVCPVAYALDVFGDQWSLLIVRDLLLSRRRAFQELVNAPEGIATNVLADRLERLTDLGVVVAAVDPDDGRRRSYFLTDKGLALFPVLFELIRWSGAHHAGSPATPAVIGRIRRSAPALIKQHRIERDAACLDQAD
ncbi:MAG: helix-turn-helix transcriptional regulator [Gemmatimonadetes bacterium]|nr:helix-turn-helix transcriptional regulator [Gemmatimonadota bacterium]MCC7131519.1 helix-turn-helix transcriptional regulator [Gemmatimonadales bacterium]